MTSVWPVPLTFSEALPIMSVWNPLAPLPVAMNVMVPGCDNGI